MLVDLPLEGAVAIGDVALDMGTAVRELQLSRQGIDAMFDVAIEAPELAVAAAREAPGPLLLERGMPPRLGSGGPSSPGVTASMAADVLNAALFSTWASGAFEERVGDLPSFRSDGLLTAGDLALLARGLEGRAPEDAEIVLEISPRLPPVLVPRGQDALELRVVDVRVEVLAKVADEDVHLLTLSVAGSVDSSLALDDDAIRASFGEPTYRTDLVEGPPGSPSGPMLDVLLADPLRQATPWIFDLGSVPMPAFHGFSVSGPMSRVDRGFVTFEGDLVYRGAERAP
jgi:hypothetical protein